MVRKLRVTNILQGEVDGFVNSGAGVKKCAIKVKNSLAIIFFAFSM